MLVKTIDKYKFAIFIFLGIVLGTLYANISVKYNAGYVDTFGSDYLALYEEVTVDGFKLWQYVCRTRIRDFTLLCIIGFTAICKPAFIFYLISKPLNRYVDKEKHSNDN